MKEVLGFIKEFRWLTILAVLAVLVSIFVLIFGGGAPASIFWTLIGLFLLKLGDRE